jgi:hypothetical protein
VYWIAESIWEESVLNAVSHVAAFNEAMRVVRRAHPHTVQTKKPRKHFLLRNKRPVEGVYTSGILQLRGVDYKVTKRKVIFHEWLPTLSVVTITYQRK